MAGYAVTISATDAATRTINAINGRVEALTKRLTDAQAPYKRLGENIEKLARVSGIGKIASGFTDLARAGTESFRSILRVVEPLAAITGAASLAGVYKLVAAWGEFGRELSNQAARAGVTTGALFGLQNAARLVGVSADTLTSGVTALSDNMRNAAFGAAPNFIVALRGLAQASGNVGVSWEELKKLTPEQQLLRLADALKKVRNPTDKALLTREIFGGDGLTPFLNQGAAGIEQLARRVRELRGEMGPEDVQRARDFAGAQEELKLALAGVGDRVASIAGPGFTILVRGITDLVVGTRQWTEANQDWLRSEISGKASELVGWLKSVDCQGMGQGIRDFASHANAVAQALGGWQTAGEAVLLFFGGVWLAKMLLPFAQLASLFLRVPVQAAEAATKASAELAKVGTKPGGPNLNLGGKTLGLGLNLAAIASDLSDGKTAEEQHQLNTDSPLARAGAWMGGKLGMSFDSEGHSEGLLHRWFGGGSAAEARGYGAATPSENRAAGFGAAGAPAGAAGGALAPLPAGEKARRARQAFDTFRAMGDSAAVASGRVANIEQESGFNERAHGDSGLAYGLGQYHPDRQAQFAERFGHSIQQGSYEEQLKFYHDDPDALARRANNTMASTPGMSSYDAGALISKMVERPRDTAVEMHRRGLRATQWEAQFAAEDRTRAAPATALAARGDAAPLAAPGGAPGAAGASGRVDMNVRVTGAPTTVTAQASPGIGVRVDNPGLLNQ